MFGVRKLACACIGYCTAIFAAHYLLGPEALIAAAIICAAAGALGFLFRNNTRKRIILILFAASLGILSYKLNYDLKVAPCEELTDSEFKIHCLVTDFPDERENCLMIYVKVRDEALPAVSGVLFDYSKSNGFLKPGDVVDVDVRLGSAVTRYHEETDLNISKGLYLLAYIEGECEVTGQQTVRIQYLPKLLAKALKTEINELFPNDAAPFMTALLTGDKTSYYADNKLSTSMSIAGLAHVVAVSGMHVAFLIGFLQIILGLNKRSAVICIALVWVFVIMVGAPPSAVRASVLQTMLLSSYMLKRENDNTTTLSFAMALILLVNPFACGSVSLQLSFAAMSGILIFTQPIYTRLCGFEPGSRLVGRIWTYIAGALSSSLAASAFTIPLVAIHFGYISVLAPLANILCLWCISLLFCGGYMICAIGIIIPAFGRLLASVIAFLVRYITLVVKCISAIPASALYTENKAVLIWLVASYAVFAIFGILKRKRRLSVILPVSAVICGYVLVLLVSRTAMMHDEGTLGVMDVGNGLCVAVTSHENTVVIDCGSAGISDDPGAMMASYLHANGRNRIDYLILTHLHEDHAKGVCKLMNLMPVDTLVLAADADNENGLLEKILACAGENGVNVEFIKKDTVFSAGDISLELLKLVSNKGGLVIRARVNEYSVLVTGDAEAKAEKELVKRQDLRDTDLYVVGHHGSSTSSTAELVREARPEIAVISVGYNSYGHPTAEVLERLERIGAELYRTDTDGRIVLRLSDG